MLSDVFCARLPRHLSPHTLRRIRGAIVNGTLANGNLTGGNSG